MKPHINHYCPLTILKCGDCKETVVRNSMDKHKSELCQERICECPYSKYGCNEKIKANELVVHVQKMEVQHLKIQVL